MKKNTATAIQKRLDNCETRFFIGSYYYECRLNGMICRREQTAGRTPVSGWECVGSWDPATFKVVKRYQVVTYSSDVGTVERMNFYSFEEARQAAKGYERSEEYAAVYDYEAKTAYVIFGNPLFNVFADWVKVIA